MNTHPTDNDGRMPVFDTCDVIRRKIKNFIRRTSLSKTAFLRAVSRNVVDCPSFQVAQLNRFLAMDGPRKGNTCGVYYAAYVFFEQRRIEERLPKSADRIQMERLYPYGVNIRTIRNSFWAPPDADVVMDRFGVVKIRPQDARTDVHEGVY